MDVFVKNLVDKATKKHGSNNELKTEGVEPQVAFHYGIPLGATTLAYCPIQKILAIATKNGQIKLLGKDNTQVLLESKDMLPSKFLQFIHSQGVLLNFTANNQIEVWDIDTRSLTCVHDFHKDITAVAVLQHSFFIYVGDSTGNVAVLKFDQESHAIERMKYNIPVSASRGNTTDVSCANALIHILPQLAAESKRVLLVFSDGLVALWDIRESKTIFFVGGSSGSSTSRETKKATSACWACPSGGRVIIGYSNGEIMMYKVPSVADVVTHAATQNGPISKLNLGYKLEKIPIASLKYVYGDGKSARLYVTGASDSGSTNLVQVVLLNDQTESRMIKVGLQLPEASLAMEIIPSSIEQNKHNKQGLFLLLGNSGHLYAYDDHLIERYLLQSLSKTPPSIPSEMKIKLPFSDSSLITSAMLITNNSCSLITSDEARSVCKNVPPLLPSEAKQFDTNGFNGFAKVKNLYITGHNDGAVKFWDASSPIFVPLLSLKDQSQQDSSSSCAAITAVFYDMESRMFVSGDQNGMVHIYRFKPEPYSKENGFISLPGNSKKGNRHFIQTEKQVKVNGPVLSISFNRTSRQVAVGCEQGYVSLVDIEEATVLYQKQIPSELSPGVISLHFGSCNIQGFEKNILVATTKDSSVLALERDTGTALSNCRVHPKKPSRALLAQILDGSSHSNGVLAENDAAKQMLLLCVEKAVYVFSLKHAVQGIKKVHQKVKFDNSCCWASTFYSSSSPGLILLFTCGRIEIRSVPELLLVKESTLKSFVYSHPKPNSYSHISMCASHDGELLVARSDQEITMFSLLPQKRTYRDQEFFSQVADKNLTGSFEDFASPKGNLKEKQKGIFSSVIKDLKGSKSKNGADAAAEDLKASFEELSTIFSVPNFLVETENYDNSAVGEDKPDLDIDDINLDDDEDQPKGLDDEQEEKPKGFNVIASIGKQKFSSKFQSLKGKFKQMKGKQEKASVEEDPQEEKAGSVDQIKKKYGFTSSSNETSLAKQAEGKLAENLKKLQGISLRTAEMQDNAQSFSSNAKDLLQAVEKNRLKM